MSPKTTDVLSFVINLGRAPELSGKLMVSNTAMVFKAIKFERKNTFLCDVALNFCYKAAFVGACVTA
jgi:hypothetical protein